MEVGSHLLYVLLQQTICISLQAIFRPEQKKSFPPSFSLKKMASKLLGKIFRIIAKLLPLGFATEKKMRIEKN